MEPRLIVIRGNSGSGKSSVVERILPTVRYGGMLARLARDHDGYFYYLGHPVRADRSPARDKASAFTAEDMADWYRPRDLLEQPRETIIDETSELDGTVQQILREAGLGRPAA